MNCFCNPHVFLPKSRYAYHVGAYFHLKMHAKLDLEMRNGHKAEYMNDNEQSASCSATLFFTNPKPKCKTVLLHYSNLMIISFCGRAIISATRISHFAVVLLFYKGIRLFAVLLYCCCIIHERRIHINVPQNKQIKSPRCVYAGVQCMWVKDCVI
jgi:hypothetical protein